MTAPADFAEQLQATLAQLTSSSPGIRILVTSIPDVVGLHERYAAADPVAQAAWAATEPVYQECPTVFGIAATAAERAAVSSRIDELNGVLPSVCHSFPTCTDDEGATFRLWPALEPADLAFDFFHLSPSGERKLAARTWKTTPFAHPRQGSQDNDDDGE